MSLPETSNWDWYGYREMNNECVKCCSFITDRPSTPKRSAAAAAAANNNNNNNNNDIQKHVSLILHLKF
jgi:hypothetical protein